MLVGSNNGNLPARNPGKVSNLVQEDALHTSRVVCGVGAIAQEQKTINNLLVNLMNTAIIIVRNSVNITYI